MKYIIFDLEATCWKDTRSDANETIEIGAVRLTSETGPIESEFCAFIKPIVNPILSTFCTELTSITQHDVDTAPKFSEVFNNFIIWIGDEPVTICSWGDYDIKQLRRDCALHYVTWPEQLTNHINLKKVFCKLLDVRRCGMKKALTTLKMSLDGTHHRGIDDARNIAKIAQVILPKLSANKAAILEALKMRNISNFKTHILQAIDSNQALNNAGETALHLAVKDCLPEFVQFLLEQNANTEVQNWHGETPLFYVALHGTLEIAQLLLEKSAVVSHENHDHETPLFYALFGENLAVVKLLLEHNAAVNILSIDDITPLECAIAKGNSEIVALLLDHNALTGYETIDNALKAAKSTSLAKLAYSIEETKKLLNSGIPRLLAQKTKTANLQKPVVYLPGGWKVEV